MTDLLLSVAHDIVLLVTIRESTAAETITPRRRRRMIMIAESTDTLPVIPPPPLPLPQCTRSS